MGPKFEKTKIKCSICPDLIFNNSNSLEFQMNKVCLIVPPSIILSKERTFPHLGPIKVAAPLLQRGIPVDQIDLSGVEDYTGAVRKYASENKDVTYGLTATSPQLPPAAEILKVIRDTRPEVKVILGGPHFTLVNASRKKAFHDGRPIRADKHFEELTGMFDTVIAGDGELAIQRALKSPDMKFIDADNPMSDLWLKPFDLNEMPLPARQLLDLESYEYYIDGVRATTMINQLGCPYPCGFCGGRYSPFLRRVRHRSQENVLAEKREIFTKYGYRAIMEYDDEENLDHDEMVSRMHATARLADELKIEWRLRGFIKSNLFNEEQAQSMFEAGFREILIGFESGSPRILRNIKKQATLDQNTRCVEIAKKAGLRVKALMSMGHPGESEETIRETEEWILAMEPESFDLTRITVYPGTPYYDDAVPHSSLPGVWTYEVSGDRLYSGDVDFLHDFSFYKGDRGDSMGLNKFTTFTDYLSSDDLARLRKETEDRLREKLGQPYQQNAPGIPFDRSMGMGLPDNILRSSS